MSADAIPRRGKRVEPRELAETAARYRPRMRSVALGILRDHDEAEDAVQDALVTALRGLDGFEGRAHLATWLHRIVVNAALMRVRRRGRRRERLQAEDPDLRAVAPGSTEGAVVARQELAAALAGLERLPARDRRVLVLQAVRGLPVRDIARLTGDSPQAIKTRIHRARRSLRDDVARAAAGQVEGPPGRIRPDGGRW